MNTDSVVAGGARRTQYSYDSTGRVVTLKDADNKLHRTQYDAINRTTRSIGPGADTTRYTYDDLFLTQVRDAKGQTYGFTSNALGWTEVETDPNGKQTRSSFDKNGNVKTWTNRRGQQVTFSYDDLDQLTARVADGRTTSYSVHPEGDFVATANAQSTDTIMFDGLGRPTWEVSVRGGTRYVIGSTYDKRNSRTRLEAWGSWSGSKLIQYRYNGDLQLDTLIDLAGGRTPLLYNEEGIRASARLPTGMTLSFANPSSHRSGSIRYSVPGVDDAFGQAYKHAKRPLISERVNVYGDSTRSYLYDDDGQLTGYDDFHTANPVCVWDEDFGQLCGTTGRTLLSSVRFSYDKAGNPTHGGAQVGTGNRLTRFDGMRLEYDADGNQTRRYVLDGGGSLISDIRYHWSSLNQLDSVRIVVPTGIGCHSAFRYDGFGRLVQSGCAGSAVRTLLLDGDHLLMELDAQGQPLREYTYYPGADRPHSVRSGGQTYYYLTDHPGNVVGLVNGSNQVVNRYRMTPWGAPEMESVQVPQPLGYGGAYYEQIGIFLRARWYDPGIQRFLSEDPIGLAGGINPYSFISNSPVNGRDPSGLDHCGALDEEADPDGAGPAHGCSGGYSVHTIAGVSTGGSSPWGFSTPRSSGFSSGFGSRGYGGGSFGSGGGGGGGFGYGGSGVTGSWNDVPEVTITYRDGGFCSEVSGSDYDMCVGIPIASVASAGRGLVSRYIPHASGRLAERGISQAMVDVALRRGTRYFDPKHGTIAHVLNQGFASGRSFTTWWDPLTSPFRVL